MGAPIFDADHNPRLADHDRNGLAHNDCGAFERPADGPVPGTVANVRWENPSVLTWDAEPDAAEYHVYRDEVANLSYANFGVCRDDLDADRTDTELDHPQDPALGSAFAFLITAEAGGGEEGTLGFATGAERSNFTPCP